MFNVSAIRAQFPTLQTTVHGKPLVYLDNAATTQKPLFVLEQVRQYYETQNANVHRGVHYLSRLATQAHEKARQTVANFIHAASTKEVLFTAGCTMSINMAANILARSGFIRAHDEVIVSTAEHHSNIVPWQMLCEQIGAVLKVIPLTSEQTLDMTAYCRLLGPKTKIVAVGHISNTLGTLAPIQQIVELAKQNNSDTVTLIDGAQAIAHLPVDVQRIGCDFYAFSGHKIYAPTGIGVLWGKQKLLEQLPPWQGGGEMIKEVTFEKTTYNELPFKYEAGTPNIAGSIGLAAALQYITEIGQQAIEEHENKLMALMLQGLKELPGIQILAPHTHHYGAISVLANGIHPYDLGTLLDQMGIAVRTGHHCCQPLMTALGTSGTLRASVAMYNDTTDIQTFLNGMERALTMLA